MSALRGSGRTRAMTRFSGPQTTIQHVRTPAGLGAQIAAARYGASGLAAPQFGPTVTTGGVARQSYTSGTATNPATLRAIARSSTPQGLSVRRYLAEQEQATSQALRAAQESAQEHVFGAMQERVSRLLSLGRTDEAANLVLRILDMAETLGYRPRGGR